MTWHDFYHNFAPTALPRLGGICNAAHEAGYNIEQE
jgi:hypothetical protein